MKLILGLFTLLVVIAFASLTFSKDGFKNFFPNLTNNPKVTINNQAFKVEIADDEKEKQIGLSGKKSLSADKGLLFIFNKADYYSFWMKNMLFPIDIIFINGDKIVTIYENVQPPTSEEDLSILQPEQPSDKVLEINANLSKKYNIKKGDSVKMENVKLSQ